MARLLVSESPDAFCEQAFYGNCLRAVAKNLPLAPILSMTELVILDSADRRGPGTPALGARAPPRCPSASVSDPAPIPGPMAGALERAVDPAGSAVGRGGRASQILPLRATAGSESICCGRFRGSAYPWYGRFSACWKMNDGWVNSGFHHGKKGAEYPINVAKWGEVG